MGLSLELALILGLPAMVIGGVWAILRDLTRTSRVAAETKNAVNTGLDELRQEVVKLRDTSTQYDMSVETTLTELRQRMAHMESRMQIQTAVFEEPAARSTPSASPLKVSTPTDQPVEHTLTLGG